MRNRDRTIELKLTRFIRCLASKKKTWPSELFQIPSHSATSFPPASVRKCQPPGRLRLSGIWRCREPDRRWCSSAIHALSSKALSEIWVWLCSLRWVVRKGCFAVYTTVGSVWYAGIFLQAEVLCEWLGSLGTHMPYAELNTMSQFTERRIRIDRFDSATLVLHFWWWEFRRQPWRTAAWLYDAPKSHLQASLYIFYIVSVTYNPSIHKGSM